MQFNTKYDFKQRVYAYMRNRVISGKVATIHCQHDRLGTSISYDVWIDKDSKAIDGYWFTANEGYLFPTAKEAIKNAQSSPDLGGKGNGKA